MDWFKSAAALNFQPNRPSQVPAQPGTAPAQTPAAQPQVPAQPGPAPQTLPKPQTQVFFEWVQKYAPQVWTYFQQMEEALMSEVDPKKRMGLQQIYQQTVHRKFSEWKAKIEEAKAAGQPESAVQLAMNWFDMIKLASSLDLNTDDQGIPKDESMPPPQCKMKSLWKRLKKRKDHDGSVPGLSQEPPLGQR